MYLGIDVGSVSTNVVMLNQTNHIKGYTIIPSGYNHKQTVEQAMLQICSKTGVSQDSILRIVGTGYGRRNIPNTYSTATEITCHALGTFHLHRNAKTIIDIGGQDSKIIRLSKDGLVDSFTMNDKCSAGTGRFLEVMASIMNMDLEEFSISGLKAKKIYKISSTCTVFAESEVISGVSKGVQRESIIAGIYQAIVERIFALAGIYDANENVILTGGVAKNMGVVEFMKKRLHNLTVPFEPQITGALGAALIAAQDGTITKKT